MTTKNTSVRLTDTEQDNLNKLAEKVGCCLRNGKPSWRILLQDMAAGTFVLFDKRKPKKKKEWKTKGKSLKIEGAPEWWSPWYGNAIGLDHAIKKSRLDRAGIIALGLKIESNPFLKHPEVVVGKPEWPAPFVTTRPHWWWSPDEGGGMDIDEALSASGLTADQLTAGGLLMDEVQFVAPESWTGWGSQRKSVATIPPMLATPSWFTRLPGMTAMPLADAIAASGMDENEMEIHGIRIRKISGKRYVTGPAGSEWDLDSDEPA